jgi:hypothetical protein
LYRLIEFYNVVLVADNVLQLREVADFGELTFNSALNPPFCQDAVMPFFFS